MNTRGAALLVALTVIAGTGCYHTRLAVKGEPATDVQKVTTHALFWGLVQENVTAANCRDGGIQQVRISTNFGYLVLSVATLGIWVPLDVEWQCAKASPPDTSAFGVH